MVKIIDTYIDIFIVFCGRVSYLRHALDLLNYLITDSVGVSLLNGNWAC